MNHQHLVQNYIALWNEADASRRLALIRTTFTPDATYLDPQMTGTGHQGLSDMIGAAQSQLPGLRFRLSDHPTEAHHGYLRFSWHLGPDEGTSVAGGTDMVELHGEQMQRVVGFIDFAPPAG